MRIRLVDSFRVRNLFGNMNFNFLHGKGISWYAPWFIPPDEVWVEKRVKNEIKFLLTAERLEKKFYQKIGSYWQARRKLSTVICKKTGKDFTRRVLKRDGLIVKLVNGETVRKEIDQSFVAGGHGLVYPWYIPKNEIWIDAKLDPRELKYILVHEMFEYKRMAAGEGYRLAHEKACVKEREARARDGIAHYPLKNPIAPLPYISLESNGKKRVLLLSGIHGDELSGPYGIARFLLEETNFLRRLKNKISLETIPVANPPGFKKGTRENSGGNDLNRWFFDNPKKGEPGEVKILRRYFDRIKKPYDFVISLHEDYERKEFYLYDLGNGHSSPIIKNIFRAVRKFGVPLYTGIDDVKLGNAVKNGCVEVGTESSFPALEEYLTRKRKAKKAVTVEVPGKLGLERKIEITGAIIKTALSII